MSVTQQQVVSLLENVLFERATQAAANTATWEANAAATSVSALAAAMAGSGEAKIATTVVGYYLASLGRAPTAAEVQYYVGIAEQGLTQNQIAAGQVPDAAWNTIASYFSHSAEFTARAGLDNSLGVTGGLLEAVPWLYQSVLGRAPSTAEISYYDNQVVSGSDLGVLFREFTASPEFHTDTDGQIATALANFGTAAATGQATSSTPIGATVQLAPPPPTTPVLPPVLPPVPTFGTLTAGTDTINDSAMTGAHTYNATMHGTSPTLSTGDSLIGNGLATLAITDTSTNTDSLLGITFSGIQAITVNTSGHVNFNVSSHHDLTSLTVTTTGAPGITDIVTANSGVDVTISSASNISLANVGTASITDSSASFALSLHGSVGAVTLLDSAESSTSVHIYAATVTGGITVGSSITELDISGGSGASSIDQIKGANLASLVIGSGTEVDFGTPLAHTILGTTITDLDLANAPSNTTMSYFTINANNATIETGLSNNTITLNGSGATITTGYYYGVGGIYFGQNGTTTILDDSTGTTPTLIDASPTAFSTTAANLIISGRAGDGFTQVTFHMDANFGSIQSEGASGNSGTQTDDVGAYSALFTEIGTLSAHVAYSTTATVNGVTSTYIAESDNGSVNTAGDLTLIKIAGTPTLSVNGHVLVF